MSDVLKRSPHYRLHKAFGGKDFFNFAGWEMPAHFSTLEEEIRACRENAIIFDGHGMGELHIRGPDALQATEWLCVNEIKRKRPGQCVYTSLCNEEGGIVDDLVVFCIAENHYLLTVAAFNTHKTPGWVEEHVKDFDVSLCDQSEGTSCLEIQGPKSREILADVVDDVDVSNEALPFYRFVNGHVSGVPCMIARLGVTGELGYEIFYDAGHADRVYELVAEVATERGASLCGNRTIGRMRLEKVYVVYTRDIDESTNPFECGLGWSVKLDKGPFIGREALSRIKNAGPERQLRGLRLDGQAEVGGGAQVVANAKEVGKVTAAGYSPTIDAMIALAYINRGGPEIGERVSITQGSESVDAEIVETPFFDPKGTRIRG